MNKDKKIICFISLLTFSALFLALFVKVQNSKLLLAAILVPLALLTQFAVKKRGAYSIKKREVLLLTAVIGVIYVVLLESTGIFFGAYKNPYFVTSKTLLTQVLPMIATIISIELIRAVMLAQKNTAAEILTYFSALTAEVLTYSTLSGVTSFNQFMDLVGMTLFPAITANIFYHYIAKRYGMLPNIAYRMITTLYIYFLPTKPNLTDALLAFAKLALPILALALLSALYEKKKKPAPPRSKLLSHLGTAIVVVIIAGVAMLISCQFRFGALVIASESMTGEINKGDIIVFEQYEKQSIKEGQVIVFQQDRSKVVHRVIAIENIDGEKRYYTKGDANPSPDAGYRTAADIVGLTDIKIAHLGYPTLWLRELIKN